MGNQKGVRLDYRQEASDEIMDRAKAECVFTDKLYDILLAFQNNKQRRGKPLEDIPPGNVGELNAEMSRLYNLIWASAVGLNDKMKSKKKQQSKQMEAVS